MRKLSAVDRVRKRVSDVLDQEHQKPMALRLTQRKLADAIGVKKSTLNEWLIGAEVAEQGVLARLDALADALGSSPAELVQAPNSRLMELAADERRVIRQWRTWPRTVRANVLRLFHYFGELLPEEQVDREYLMTMRQLRAVNPAAHERQLLQARDALKVARQQQYARTQANALAGPRRRPGTGAPIQTPHGRE